MSDAAGWRNDWFISYHLLLSGPHRLVQEHLGEKEVAVSLTIDFLEEEDLGNYSCYAENAVGKRYASVIITRRGNEQRPLTSTSILSKISWDHIVNTHFLSQTAPPYHLPPTHTHTHWRPLLWGVLTSSSSRKALFLSIFLPVSLSIPLSCSLMQCSPLSIHYNHQSVLFLNRQLWRQLSSISFPV